MNADHLKSLLDRYEPDWRDPELAQNQERLLFYLELREQGNDHRLAAMFACQRAPAANTDREFFEGRHTLAEQFQGNDRQLAAVIAAARKQGYDPKPTDTYLPTLAQTTGDPQAFIPAGGGRSHVRRVCEERGLTCMGAVNIKGREPEKPIEPGKLAPDLVAEIIEQKIAANPDLARVDRRDLAEEVQYQHGYTDTKRAGRSAVNDRPAVRSASVPSQKKGSKP
jgi:hypothetical protein